MCECFIRLTKYERASPMERALWRRRIEKEEITKLLHVEESCIIMFRCLGGCYLFFDPRWFGTCAHKKSNIRFLYLIFKYFLLNWLFLPYLVYRYLAYKYSTSCLSLSLSHMYVYSNMSLFQFINYLFLPSLPCCIYPTTLN